jgi:hypothetical protein
VPAHATLRSERVTCGRCPRAHGPYWYAYFRERGRLVKRYLGKRLPRRLRRAIRAWDRSWRTRHLVRALHREDARFSRTTVRTRAPPRP